MALSLPAIALPLFILAVVVIAFSRMPFLQREAKGGSGGLYPRLSVIIPARNEADNLERLLRSLEQQSLRPDEVVVIDDHSVDQTASLAQSLGATVIRAPDLPAGWLGKSWACWLGAQKAKGEVLIFLDADVFLEKEAILSLLQTYEVKKGLVSVQPYHFTIRSYEKLSAFFNLVLALNMALSFILKPLVKTRGAFGPCLITGRQDYLAVGGHQAVRSEILEDICLARRFLEKGLSVYIFGGKGKVYFRMYPQGLKQLVEGWTKNFASGAFSSNILGFFICAVWITFCLSIPLNIIKEIRAQQWLSLIFSIILYLLYAGQIHWSLSRLGNFGLATAAFYPLPLLFFIIIFFRSFFYTYCLRYVTWKGRKVNLSRKLKPKAY